MTLYRANIKPVGAFASPLQSDTFFGAFCWAYRYLYGEEALLAMLEESVRGEPRIIFSNAFPGGYLPLPMGTYDQDRQRYSTLDKSAAKQAYQYNKKLKKCTLVGKEAFMDLQRGNRSGFSRYMRSEPVVQAESVHNLVGRADGVVSHSDEGGSLFVKNEFFLMDDECLDVYILSDLPAETVTRVLELMLELGIGGSKSTGKGSFALLGFDEEKELIQDVENANGYVALSNFIPDREDPTEGWYKTFVKHGKLDREYAAGRYPFKKALLYIQAGAMFKSDHVRPWYGRIMTDISAIPNVVVNACTIALPMRVPE